MEKSLDRLMQEKPRFVSIRIFRILLFAAGRLSFNGRNLHIRFHAITPMGLPFLTPGNEKLRRYVLTRMSYWNIWFPLNG